jgi:sugar phosphate isomerase/epimerase
MQLGIFAKTFAGSEPLKVLSSAKAAGYRTVQYNMACSGLTAMPDVIVETIAASVASMARTAGIRIAAVSGTYNMIHPNIVERNRGHGRLAVLASSCAAMETGLITLCTGTRDPLDQWRWHPDNASKEAWQDLLQAMEAAIAIAEQCNIDLGIEPELANVVNSAATARQLLDELKSPRLKIVLDPANLFEREPLDQQRRIVSDAIELLADSIVMGHAKDRTVDGTFTTAGRGCLDYPHYMSSLKAIGFDGPLITHGLTATEASGVAQFLKALALSTGVMAE